MLQTYGVSRSQSRRLTAQPSKGEPDTHVPNLLEGTEHSDKPRLRGSAIRAKAYLNKAELTSGLRGV